MFERILVALDNSTSSHSLFNTALTLAKTTHARLMLLHVLSDEEIGYPNIRDLPDHLERWENSKTEGRSLLRSRQATAIAAGIETEIAQPSGISGSTICQVAQDWQADLIVLGHRGLSGLNEAIRGSVSNHVIHYAPCSVLMVQGRTDSLLDRFLIALDGSSISQQAFDAGLALAKLTGAELRLLHVLSLEEKDTPGFLSLFSRNEQKEWQAYEKPGLDLLRGYQDLAAQAAVHAEMTQTIGSPGRVICEFAGHTQSQLIVVGRRGLSGLSELLLGSVSNYVTHYASTSVLIVQGQAQTGLKVAPPNAVTSAV